MSLYEPKPKPQVEKKKMLGIRALPELHEDLKLVVELWKVLATRVGDDPSDVDVTYVATRILNAGVAIAVAEFSGRKIKTPEDLAAVKADLLAKHPIPKQ